MKMKRRTLGTTKKWSTIAAGRAGRAGRTNGRRGATGWDTHVLVSMARRNESPPAVVVGEVKVGVVRAG
jgi:hypothetical protein